MKALTFLFLTTWPCFANERDSARMQDPNPAKLKAIVETWPECDEYMSKSPCRVTINLGTLPDPNPAPATGARAPLMPRSHWDVQVPPFVRLVNPQAKGEAAILLIHSSPFLSCTVAASPSAPGRDLSANIGSLLTAVAGIGAPFSAPSEGGGHFAALMSDPSLFGSVSTLVNAPAASDEEKLNKIIEQINGIPSSLTTAYRDVSDAYADFKTTVKAKWKFTFWAKEDAIDAINLLQAKILNAQKKVDDFSKPWQTVSLIDAELTRFEKMNTAKNPTRQADIDAKKILAEKIVDAQNQLIRMKALMEVAKARMADFGDKQKLLLQVNDYLNGLKDPNMYPTPDLYTTQALPMAFFSGKTATETITCKDAVTKDQAFDNIIFTAYYEALPHIDISVGVIGSLLGGRQVGTITAPYSLQSANNCATTPMAVPPCGPSTVLGYTSKSSYQFMPGVFVEWRMKNYRCPWARNGEPWHPAGYVCSIGVAGGVAINPNNGGPAAEFFEGISFGIQRFSIMIGVHNGRYQEYGGGYYAGETFNAGAPAVTPPTVYGWATHPAFAIAYRIPLR
jgi:hypothetical protein